MQRKELVETLTGAVVVALGLVAIAVAYLGADQQGEGQDGYVLTAEVPTVGSLREGADVRIGGIAVGEVSAMRLKTKTLQAVVEMTIQDEVQIPTDSAFKISSDGLLGDNFVTISIGGEEKMFVGDSKFRYAQGAIDVVDLVSRLISSGVDYEIQQSSSDN
ncbi:MAG: MlaD family protein [Pseudomonadota bacterium]